VWNRHVWGFGSNATGAPREAGKCSRWDTIHPGRSGVGKKSNAKSAEEILDIIRKFVAGDEVEEAAEEIAEAELEESAAATEGITVSSQSPLADQG